MAFLFYIPAIIYCHLEKLDKQFDFFNYKTLISFITYHRALKII